MEGADQVLALPRVDAGLAADRGIDLGQQRGRHLHDADAAPQDAGGKAGQIADHAAAKRDDAIAPLDAKLEQAFAERRQHGEALARLAGADHGLAEKQALSIEARLQRPEIERRHIAVADHRAARAGKRSSDAPPGRGDQTLADDDRVAPSRKLHLDDCLALAVGQGGRAVAHHFTFLRPSACPHSPCSRACRRARRSPRRRSRHAARRGSPPSHRPRHRWDSALP